MNYIVIENNYIGKNIGLYLMSYALDDINFEFLYFDSAEEFTSIDNNIEVWSHTYWDKVAETIGKYRRESNIIAGKFIKETLYRISDKKIKSLIKSRI
jgi:hypothetical protein